MHEPDPEEALSTFKSLVITGGAGVIVGGLAEPFLPVRIGSPLTALVVALWALRAARRGPLVPLAALPLIPCLAVWTLAEPPPNWRTMGWLVAFVLAAMFGALGADALEPIKPGWRDASLRIAHHLLLLVPPLVAALGLFGGAAVLAWVPLGLGYAAALISLGLAREALPRGHLDDGDYDDEVGLIHVRGRAEPVAYRDRSLPGGPVVLVTAPGAPVRRGAHAFRSPADGESPLAVIPGTIADLAHADRMQGICARLVAVTVAITPVMAHVLHGMLVLMGLTPD